MQNLRIALVHDYLKEYGGAERVLEALHELFPEAPVYTTVYCPDFLGPHKKRFEKWDIRTSFLQKIPYHHKLISIFRLVAPFAFKSFNFSDFDIIITSATGAYSPNILNKGKAKLISYTHTPPRYLYGYATAREWKNNPVVRMLAEVANHILRIVDFKASENVDLYIANSENVAGRIKKFYRKKALVVYPPVDIVGKAAKKKDYFVAGGRLARPKHVDLIIKAANELGVPLKIFGKGFAGYGEELQTLAGKTVSFVGEVSDVKKLQLMSQAKAFIMASEDEDFGIVPVEAMGVGTPVIAYYSGGLKESVVGGKTGVFFDKLEIESLVGAMKKFEKAKIVSTVCINQAKNFSKTNFMKQIKETVEQYA